MDQLYFIAHKRKSDGERQSLRSHLSEVGEIAAELARKIGLPNAGALLGLLHDFGKYSQEFQAYIKSATGDFDQDDDGYVEAGKLKGKIDHSTAGAQLVWQMLSPLATKHGQGELCGQILALCIASHHSGLIDCFNKNDEPVFSKRMAKAEEKVHLRECQAAADKEVLDAVGPLAGIDLVKEMFAAIKQIVVFPKRPEPLDSIGYFNLGFVTRFLFSCLIDADRLNSAEFEDPLRLEERLSKNGPVPWGIAIDRLESFLAGLSPRNYVDHLRREISDNCKTKASQPQGIYTLTVPTGGGKTYASLRYALHHARAHGLERIIYIIPYTSIIEQNAQAVRDVVESEYDLHPWVLEHHSNLEPEQQSWQSKLVSENWDAPIVLTTSVQLLETLFSGGTKGVRRLHQLAKSVLIFDEIQTLPINCVHLFCNALNFLTRHCDTTAVLCTATQPLLNELKRPEKGQLTIPPENELAGDFERHFVDLKRVEVHNLCKSGGWLAGEITDLVLDKFRRTNSCLVIVNTKAWAQELYQRCSECVDDGQIFHLSTNQYPAHRKALLEKIRGRLDNSLPVLCISTQLIEAGVDVDFACVFRFLAGLDSIAQAAGRCNRNGKLMDAVGKLIKGQVYVLNPDQETVDILKDIKVGKEKAERVLSEGFVDLVAPDAIEQYFRYYFFDRSDDMIYPLASKSLNRDENLLNLLSNNPNCYCKDPKRDYADPKPTKLPLLRQAFMEAGRQFKAIDAPTQSVIIRHDGGVDLVNELCAVAKEFDPHRYYELLRKAQKFSVNVFPNVWQKLLKAEAVQEIQPEHGIYYLKDQYYSKAFGLSTELVSQQPFLGV